MNPLGYLRSLGRRFFHRSQLENDLEQEIHSHLEFRIRDLERFGFNRNEAERRARIEFGSPEQFKEECREALGANFIDVLVQDVRFNLRMLRKMPGFTIVAILTMALGIGATTAIFSVVDATLLHPLPYPQPEQLVRIQDELPGNGASDVGMSQPELVDLQHSGIFDYVSPSWYDDNNLTGGSQPARVSLSLCSPNYFALLGAKPALGRTFPASDHSPGILPEVVISDGLWKRTFGTDPNIVGKNIRMDTDLYQIVGVMPPNFHDPGRTPRERNIEVWAASSFYGAPLLDQPARSGRNLPTSIARLKPGLTVATAQSKVDALVASLRKQFPADYPPKIDWQIRLVPLQQSVVGDVRQSLVFLLLAVGMVLVIGCVNIANLLLARASTRGREMAIRQALGAPRARLTRQLLTESLILSLLGGITGLGILLLAKGFLVRLVPENLPRFNNISISWGVLLFAFGISLLSGLIFGLAPALQIGRLGLNHALKQEGRGTCGSSERTHARQILVVTEFALSLVLMIAAGLLLHSFWDLLNAPLGFHPESVMTIKTRIPYPNDPKLDHYATATQQAPFFREVLDRCRRLRGVEEAAFGDLGALPLAHDRTNQNPPITMRREGRETEVSEAQLVDECIVSPEYFHLVGMTLQRGRLFNDLDNDKAELVAVVNEAMAKTYWPNEEVIGKHVKLTRRATAWTTIVGVVANSRTESLEDARIPQIYENIYQQGAKHLAIFLRGHLDTAAIPDQVREAVQSVDQTLPVFGAQTLNDTVSAALSQRRFSMEMVGLFALTALLLAGLGIYGVISYATTERTHEIGIRLALGAQTRTILRMILRQGMALAVIGTGAGLIVGLITSRLMQGLLYGVHPRDPIVFISVPLMLFAVAVIGSYLPARRATKVDPIVALRAE